jgi:hypothetical protein
MSGEVLILGVIRLGNEALAYVTDELDVAYLKLVCATNIDIYVETYMSTGTDLHDHNHTRAREAPQ